MIRVMLVEDHRMVSEALSSAISESPGFVVTGQAYDGASVLAHYRALQPDVVVMDISLPDISGVDVTSQLVAEFPTASVLAVSTHLERETVNRALASGALGYVHKTAGIDELLRGIRATAARTPYLCQSVAAMLARVPEPDAVRMDQVPLGKREKEVLCLVASGMTSAQIGEHLKIATGTVDVHRYNIMRKLAIHNVAALTRYALKEGLVSD